MRADDLGALGFVGEKSSTFETVRLKATTVKPWSFMFRIRFWPMTARPISPMSYSALAKGYLRYGDFCCQFHTQFYTWGQCGRIQRTPLLNSRMGMSSTTSVPETQAPKLGMIVLLSWLIPGGGHFLLKKHYRAGLIAASVLILFILGLLMRGYMFDPQTGDVLTIIIYVGGFVANLASGIPYILTKLFGYSQWRYGRALA